MATPEEIAAVSKEKDTRKKRIARFVGYIIFFVLMAGFTVGVAFFSINVRGIPWGGNNTYRILCDAFFVPGVFAIGFFFLTIASEQGTFDMLVYGVKKVFFNHLLKNSKGMLPDTYAEYEASKRGGKEKHYYWLILIAGAVFLILSIVFLVIYDAHYVAA